MLRNKLVGLCFIMLVQIVSSTAIALPSAMSAVFDVARNGSSVGYLQSSLAYLGQTYEYTKITQSTGLAKLLTKASISEKAVGKYSGERLVPVSYLFDQKTRKKQVKDQARFAGNRASGMYKGNAYSLQTPANVLDRASLEIAVARDLNRNSPRLQYNVMERGKIKQYVFARVGTERLTTNAGTFNTVKVQVKRQDRSRTTTYWMAKELAYLPVKMLHEEGDDVISSILREFRTR